MSRLHDGINALVSYGIRTSLLPEYEKNYAINLLLDIFKEDSFETGDTVIGENLEDILEVLIDEGEKRGMLDKESVTERDNFDTRLMNTLMPRPYQVAQNFKSLYEKSPEEATDYFYKLSMDSNYIRRYRIEKDIRWSVESRYGEIDLSINLSKPEKDPKAIAAAGKKASLTYPKCQLCMENMGYAGRLDHPARETHRIIPLKIAGEDWGFQYSPYVYYNEHSIVLAKEHRPMAINEKTFERLLDFVRQFPHYFIGSNADLPIVGGSILSHDHFQGGRYTFAMEKAGLEEEFGVEGFEDIKCGIVKWPLSVIRISGRKPDRLVKLASYILDKWRGYTDKDAFVFAETNGEKHNTITPIARRRGDEYELDLALRNNITTEEFPDGLYHPHPERHNIKKENIGLIEVMGLAILPARLKSEMALLEEYIASGRSYRENELLAKHADWADSILGNHNINAGDVQKVLFEEIGKTFVGVLEDAGVFKCTAEGREAFKRFIKCL